MSAIAPPPAGYWIFDRPARLWDLALKVRAQQEYLTRSWVDADAGGRRAIEAWLLAVARRLVRLRAAMRDPRDRRKRYGAELPEMWRPPWGDAPRVGRGPAPDRIDAARSS